jgi:hypothetical protein
MPTSPGPTDLLTGNFFDGGRTVSRHLFGFVPLVTLVLLFSDNPLRAQAIFDPSSEFGPYVHQATLSLSDGATDDAFGRLVAFSGDVALVGGGGVVYVFERHPHTDTWQEVAPIRPVGQVEGFGRASRLIRGRPLLARRARPTSFVAERVDRGARSRR